MSALILPFEAIRREHINEVGGKGANLGELCGAGFPVPGGFCVTTQAYRGFVAPQADEVYARLHGLARHDLEAIRSAGQEVRQRLMALPLPDALHDALVEAWRQGDPAQAYAVRSSATAEDLPNASFAGQQDTYLNVIGEAALLARVRECFVSLFTDRAILYRIQSGFAHEHVALSVVVQRMVLPQRSGIMFTADPISEHRQVLSIDASYGLGEALVSGLVSADLYKVDKRRMAVISKQVARKLVAIEPLPEGGTRAVELPLERQQAQVLDDAQLLALAELGARVEAHYGCPQDIEWAMDGDALFITQSRPITSLYPMPPDVAPAGELNVFMSLSHLQVMTDPMPPLAASLWRRLPPVGLDERGDSRVVQEIGGRLYAEVGPLLRHPLGQRLLLNFLGVADQQSQAALGEVVARPEFSARGRKFNPLKLLPLVLGRLWRAPLTMLFGPTQGVVARVEAAMLANHQEVVARFDPRAPLAQRLREVIPAMRSAGAVASTWIPTLIAGMAAQRLLRKLSQRFEVSARARAAALLDALERGLEGNVVTRMNLALGDLGDLARQEPLALTMLEALQRGDAGSPTPPPSPFMEAWTRFLQDYGARSTSEIDLSRARWRSDQRALAQMVLAMSRHEHPGEHRRHYEALIAASREAAVALPGLAPLALRPLVRRLIKVARAFMPLREHHKFLLVQTMAEIRPLCLEAARCLVQRGQLAQADDVWFLTFPELIDAVGQSALIMSEVVEVRRAKQLIAAHRAAPRVITSDGEVIQGRLHVQGAPDGALIGSPVSAGVFEGIAKVIHDPAVELLEPGEILIAPFTDPGWTPLFVNAGALVTEVGGLMTHGSVVAREYGIPAVVGVDGACAKIKSGDRIRVHGAEGYVELLKEVEP